MYKGTNKTALTSQSQIADALISLMEEKTFASISVCELCKRADVSRQTFYSLFDSKEKVINFELDRKYCVSLGGEPCCCSGKAVDIDDICRIYASYIKEKKEFIRLLEKNNMLTFVYEDMYNSLMECSSFFPEVEGRKREYICSGLAGLFAGTAKRYVNVEDEEEEIEEFLLDFVRGRMYDILRVK